MAVDGGLAQLLVELLREAGEEGAAFAAELLGALLLLGGIAAFWLRCAWASFLGCGRLWPGYCSSTCSLREASAVGA